MEHKFDIIIVGGGIVGLSFAACLQSSKLKIAIVEKTEPVLSQNKQQYDMRVSAINRTTENIFKDIAVWEAIKSERVSCYKTVKVWDVASASNISFSHKDISEANLGHIIENRVMRKALYNSVSKSEYVSLFVPAEIESFWHEEDSIQLQLVDGEQLSTKLLVAADGANSCLRKQAGFTLRQRAYEHSAVVCTIKTEKPHQQTARQWFFEGGILALLPLREENYCSIVWSTTAENADLFSKMDAIEFANKLQQASQNCLGPIAVQSKLASFPLSMRHADDYVKPRLALVGDAAHTLHPLAGQGVNLGIADAACLAGVIHQAQQQARDFGLLHSLRKYQRARRTNNCAMIAAMGGFKYLFSQEAQPIVWLRGLGLGLTDRLSMLKALFAKQALGV